MVIALFKGVSYSGVLRTLAVPDTSVPHPIEKRYMRRGGCSRIWLNALWILGIGIFLMVQIWLSPVAAQVPAQADVVLDGQQIFQLSRSEQFTAQERADLINLQLREAVQSNQPIQIRTEQRNNQPTILLNGRHLLTVTQLDVVPPASADEQAEVWAKQLQTALQNAQTERSPDYFRRAVVQAVGILLVAIALFWGMGWLTRWFSEVVHRRLPAQASPLSESSTGIEALSKLVLVVARVILGIATILYIANLFPLTRRWSYQITLVLLTTFTAPILTLDRASYSFWDLLILAALLFSLVVFVRILTDFFKLRVLSAAGINRGAQEAIATLIKYTLMTLGVLILLQIWGLNISSLAILASALGIGIGFGMQDIAKNFVSGLVLVFERPIQVGDFVQVGNLHGTVERLGARSTEIRTLDHVSIIVPNSRFLQQEVINWSHGNPISRLHLPVGVSYSANPEKVRTTLIEAASSHPSVLQNPSPQVFFKGFGDNALDFELLIWIAEPNRQFVISSDVYFLVYAALHQQQIEIPFPQRDLHIRSGSLRLSPEVESALIQLSETLPIPPSPDSK